MKNKKLLLAVTVLMMSFMLCACGHEHEWKEATCTDAKICNTCGETEGSALGHDWKEATCIAPKKCNTCGTTEGGLAEHKLNASGRCSSCNEKIGFGLNTSNYKSYINVKTEGKKGSYGSMCTYVEPVANVEFRNVAVVMEFLDLDKNHKKIQIKLDSSGYGVSEQFQVYSGSAVVVSAIYGFIIE